MSATVEHTVPDPAARLAELDQSCQRGIYLIALRAFGDEDDAREVVQETLARAVAAIRGGRVPPEVPLARFVHGIARHVIADEVRSRARHPTSALESDAPVAAPIAATLDAIVHEENRAHLAMALRQLPDEDRDLLWRCYATGEAMVDIAASLGVSSDRIRKRKSRVIEKLRALLRLSGHESAFPTTEGT